MSEKNLKVAFKDLAAFLEANQDKLVKIILPQAYTFMTANTSAKDQAICDVNGNVIAILDSFTKRLIPVKGKMAVDIGKGNGSTKYATMGKLSNAVYSRQLAKWHKANDKRTEDLEFNNSLVSQFLAGELKADELESQKREVQDQAAVEAIKTHTPSKDDNGNDISEYLKLGWATREEAVKALSAEFKVAA